MIVSVNRKTTNPICRPITKLKPFNKLSRFCFSKGTSMFALLSLDAGNENTRSPNVDPLFAREWRENLVLK